MTSPRRLPGGAASPSWSPRSCSGSAAAASAHSSLERSDPPNLGMVAIGRAELTLWFGEPVDDRASSFSVRRTDPVPASVPATASVETDGRSVHLAVPPLERGTYLIRWAVVAEDGHPTSGTITFGAGLRPAGSPATAAAAGDDGTGPGLVALRLADLAGLLVAIGAVAVSGRVLRALGGTGRALRPRVLRLGAAAAVLCVVAAALTPVLRAREQLGATASADAWLEAVRDLVTGTTWGLLWMLRLAVGTVVAVALWRCGPERTDGAEAELTAGAAPTDGRAGRRPDALLVATGALVASAGLDAWAGHAATLPARSGAAVLAATGHVLASGVWAGGLLVVVVGLRPLARLDRPTRRVLTSAAWRAYSPMAAVAAGLLAATGVYLAGRQVPTVSSATASPYGTAVVAKVLLLATALALASYSTLVVNPRLADTVLGTRVAWRPRPRRLSTTVTAELVVLATAVAVAALMTTVPTAREAGRAGTLSAPVSDTVDGLFVTFEAVPTGSSQHLVVRTEPVVRPVAGPVTGAEVGVAAPGAGAVRVTLRETESGRYEGTVADPAPGDWSASVVLHRDGRPDSVLVVPWSPGSREAATPLEVATSALAVLLLAAIGSVLLLVAARRRRRNGADVGCRGARRDRAARPGGGGCTMSGHHLRRPRRRPARATASVAAGVVLAAVCVGPALPATGAPLPTPRCRWRVERRR